jgi:hypothetical protein
MPPDATQRGYSVPDLAMRWKVSEEKIRGWLARGELVAVNVASNLASKPQWRVLHLSVERFEQRRSSAPPPKPVRRRRRTLAVVDYFPD